MVILAGLEVAIGAAAASALRKTENGRWAMDKASEWWRAAPAEEQENDVTSPLPVKLRARSLRLPELRGPPELSAEDRVLHGVLLVEQVSNAVPRRYGDVGGSWHLLFSTAVQGRSLAHLLHLAAPAGPVVLMVRDGHGRVFGAYCSELREPAAQQGAVASTEAAGGARFYGTGESFLFAIGAQA